MSDTEERVEKFTPGPWRAGENQAGTIEIAPEDNPCLVVAYVHPIILETHADMVAGDPTEVADHNAHLIAAAPQMYEALKAYEQWEADMILCDESWAGGIAPFPTLSPTLWDRLLELQGMRNAALSAAAPNGGGR